MLIPGKLYKLVNVIYPRPFIYFINGTARRCATKPGIDNGDMFLFIEQCLLNKVGNKVHGDKMGFKILVGTETGWIWFREGSFYELYFEEVKEGEQTTCG